MNCKKITDINTFISINTATNFCLDTNVLYWYTYPRYDTLRSNPNAQVYFDFVDKLVADGNPLFTTIYNISELLNIIEKNEFDIYKTLNSSVPIGKKDYRRIESERTSLKNIMNTTMTNVNSICKVIDFNFSSPVLTSYIDNLSDHRCDVFDYLILNHYVETNNLNIISDDSDFSTFQNINLYTANTNILPSL